MGDAFRYLYEKFILRDILSFITPGALIVLVIVLVLIPEKTISGSFKELLFFLHLIHWVFYIILFGFFFVIGFSIQCCGELFGIIYYTPDGKGDWKKRLSILRKDGLKPDDRWWKEDEKKIVEFYEYLESKKEKHEWAEQWRERRIILKQMCANNFLSIFTSVIIIVVNQYIQYLATWLVIIVLVFLLFSLYWGFRLHLLRQDTITKEIIHEYDKPKIKT